jgi:hypothetical protein
MTHIQAGRPVNLSLRRDEVVVTLAHESERTTAAGPAPEPATLVRSVPTYAVEYVRLIKPAR